MAAKNPRLLNAGGQVPVLVANTLGTTATLVVSAPGTAVDYVVKQIILANLGAATNVVHLYFDSTTTVSSVERIIETSVPADSTTVLYVSFRMSGATLNMYANATAANEVNISVVGDAEAV